MRKRPTIIGHAGKVVCSSGIKALSFSACIHCMLFSIPAYAFDLNGLWTTDTSVCDKMFVKTNGEISMSKESDLYGSGFIVDGNKIRGKIASCDVKARKQDGAILNLVAVCSTDIALSTMQLVFKMDEENKITRQFPGMPEMETAYFRCP